MKRILVALMVMGLLSSVSLTASAKDLKIGYVDIFKVFNEYKKTKDYDKKLETQKNEAEKQLDKKKQELEKLQNKLSLLKEEEQKKQQEVMAKEVKAYRELERKVFVDVKKERDEKMKEIIDDINAIVDDYAKKNSFSLIVNKNAVLYGDKVMDITSDILKIANKKYKSK
ncbi:MAG: OmpH family outer membrane protein [Candidatus Omnitrophica bacterium]|nr:OmpH family outer membrane protein [Candidatus Omnitrophota bacterium]MDD5429854.1 OmpH family outer membrane protein [Candidatus Omnitrophota bacterium]